MCEIKTKKVKNLTQLIKWVLKKVQRAKDDSIFVFRGERKDYKEPLVSSIYRNGYIKNEEVIFRESQRFNNEEFRTDKTAFDRLARMQHYSTPTRLVDVSQDLFTALYFALEKKDEEHDDCHDAVIYLLEIEQKKIKYYDSDAVSVISNLSKIPLKGGDKSKKQLAKDVKRYIERNESVRTKCFNKLKSAKFLRHEIREEKPHFEPIIDPNHLASIQFVYPKFSNDRVSAQKGAFLLFGINLDDVMKPIRLISDNEKLLNIKGYDHPVKNIFKVIIRGSAVQKIRKELNSLGITKPFIYPEMDKVSEDLQSRFNKKSGVQE